MQVVRDTKQYKGLKMEKKTNAHEELIELAHNLAYAISIAKAGKYAMSTNYTQGLDDVEIADIFDGLVILMNPIQEKIFDLGEELKEVKKVIKVEREDIHKDQTGR